MIPALAVAAVVVLSPLSTDAACGPGQEELVVVRSASITAQPFPASAFGGTKINVGATLCGTVPVVEGTGLFQGRKARPVVGGFIPANEVAAIPEDWNDAAKFTDERAVLRNELETFGFQTLIAVPSPVWGIEEVGKVRIGDVVEVNTDAQITDADGTEWLPVRTADGSAIGWLRADTLTTELPEPPKPSPSVADDVKDQTDRVDEALSPSEQPSAEPGLAAPFEASRLVIALGGVISLIGLLTGVNALMRRTRKTNAEMPTVEPVGLPPAPLDD